MTNEQDLNNYQRATDLAEAGKYEQAYACIKEHLRTAPNDAQAFNDMGVILHCMGRSDEAINHLVHARNLHFDSAEIVWNLVEAYLTEGKAKEVVNLFNDMQRLGILNVDVFNRTANVFLDKGDKTGAIDVLLRSLQLWPSQKILEPMIEVIRAQRSKVVFFCEIKDDQKFIKDICDYTEQRFPVNIFEGQSIDQMYELMQWCDIAWFEGCTNISAEASKLPKVCKNIFRLHNFEAVNQWLSQVRWENIDFLIMIGNSFLKEALINQVPDIENRTRLVTIPNGINLDKFKPISRERGKNLACIGHLNMRNNPMFLLQCMQKLNYIDPEYKLFFAGDFQNQMLDQYLRHIVQELQLTNAVFFDGWQDDMNAWLSDKNYIVSGSIGESQGIGILEGMACGLKPIIHNFPGAREIFPQEFLFNISEQFCEQILSNSYEPERYRRFVEQNHPLKNQLTKISNIFSQLETEIDLQKNESQIDNSPENEDFRLFTKPSISSFASNEAD